MSAPTASLTLLANTRVSNGWRLLRLDWPHPAPAPGQWLELRAAGQVVRLPVSHASSRENWLALLAPPPLASALADWAPQSRLEVDGPRGPALQPCAEPPVLLAADAGIPAALFFVETAPVKPRLALLGGRLPPPFRPIPTQFMLAGLSPEAIAAAPMLEAQAVPSRLAQAEDRPGCFEGSVVELLQLWLASQPPTPLDLLACLPEAEADALTALALAAGHRLRIVPALA